MRISGWNRTSDRGQRDASQGESKRASSGGWEVGKSKAKEGHEVTAQGAKRSGE